MFVGYFCPPVSGSGCGSRDPIETGSGSAALLVCVGAQVHDRAPGLQPGHRGAHAHHEAQASHRSRALCQED
jgi:hypothetical protein